MKRALRVLLWLLATLVLLLVLIVGAAVALVASESGTRWLFAQAERLAPVTFSVERVEGTLFRGLGLYGVHLALPDGPMVDLEEGHVAVDARALTGGKLHLPLLATRGTRIELPALDPDAEPAEPDPERPPFALPDRVRLPLAIRVETVEIADLRVLRDGEELLEVTRLEAQLAARGSRFEIVRLSLDMPEVEAQLQAELEAADRWPLAMQANWQAPLPGDMATALQTDMAYGRLRVTGALLDTLRLRHDLEAGAVVTTELEARALFDDPQVDLDTGWQAFDYRLSPEQTLHIAAGDLDVAGSLDDWRLRLDAALRLDDHPQMQLAARARGNRETLQIERLALDSAAGTAELSGPVRLADPLEWDLRLQADDLSPALFGSELDAGIERLRASLQGCLPLDGDAAPLGALDAAISVSELRGHYGDHGLQGRLAAELSDGEARLFDTRLQLADAATLALKGQIDGLAADLADPANDLTFDLLLDLEAPDLAALPGGVDGHIEQLRATLAGRFAPASGRLNADLELDPLRAGVHGIGISGLGRIALTESGAAIQPLRLETTDGGRLQLTGDFGWGDGVDWDLVLNGEALDPALLLPEAPGRIDLALSTRGQRSPAGALEATAELQRLTGELRGQPLSGSGRLLLADQELEIETLDLALGSNRLAATGVWAENVDLAVELDAPELDQLLPELAGRLQLEARVAGDARAPHVTAEGSGAALRYRDHSLGRMELAAEAAVVEDGPANLDLRLNRFAIAGDPVVDQLTLAASGTTGRHRLTLDATAPEHGTLGLTLNGGLDVDTTHWSGELTRLDLDHPLGGGWSLTAPVTLEGGPESARLGQLCLARGDGRLCTEGEWDRARGGQGELQVADVDLAWLEPLLPPELAIEGTLRADASAGIDAAGVVSADLAVTPSDGRLRVIDELGERQEVPYRDARLTARVRDRDVDAALRMDFLENGRARADVRLRPDGAATRIDGDLAVQLDDPGWIAALSPELERLRGVLDAHLEFGGHLDAPLVAGHVRFTDGGVLIPEAGIDIVIPEITAEVISTERMTLSGRLESGEGAVNLTGAVDLGADGPRLELTMAGEDFLVVNRDDIQARITPDLELLFMPQIGIRVRGEVLLPWARITPPDLPPGAVRVSGDEVILGEEHEAAEALRTDIRIRIRLGDDVRFEGYGLTARFAGEVDVEERTGQPTQLFGEMTIPEGEYTSYGQDLRIERGVLLFQGPAQAPELDLRAARSVPAYNVVVGLEIGGTPDNLRSRIFSEPPMDETEAMAFLLTGRPLAGASESDGNIMAAAAASWGLEQGALITQRIGQELGLDEVELETGNGVEETALTLGLYLSPRLLLRYSIGLFDDSSRVLLRYELTRSLSLETSSGTTGQAVDLIYRIER